MSYTGKGEKYERALKKGAEFEGKILCPYIRTVKTTRQVINSLWLDYFPNPKEAVWMVFMLSIFAKLTEQFGSE